MTYEERRQARIERLEAKAAAAEREADSRIGRAREMASFIPFGQPILIGHHSEKRDRNYRARIDANFRKGFEAQEKAKHYRQRAAAAASNRAISSDDEAALDKLRTRIAEAEATQTMMKAVNRVIRRKPRNEATPEKLEEISRLLGGAGNKYFTSPVQAFEPDCCGRIGFPDYALQNNNANIRRMKARLAELEAMDGRETTSQEFEGFELVENAEENRVQFIFPGKPAAEIRKVLKAHGFRWAPSQGAWQRHLNANGRSAARTVAEKLQAWEPADAYARALEDEDPDPCSDCSAGPILGYPDYLCLNCEPAARG
jgi:hypothetical protein